MDLFLFWFGFFCFVFVVVVVVFLRGGCFLAVNGSQATPFVANERHVRIKAKLPLGKLLLS